jgi:hypothetical protein
MSTQSAGSLLGRVDPLALEIIKEGLVAIGDEMLDGRATSASQP